jgi:hypothetical protein
MIGCVLSTVNELRNEKNTFCVFVIYLPLPGVNLVDHIFDNFMIHFYGADTSNRS